MFCFFLFCSYNINAAGVKISADFPTKIKILLSTGTVRAFDLNNTTWDLFKMFAYDAFFQDGPSVGIKSIQWQAKDGLWYETMLDLKGSDGFAILRINDKNEVIDPTRVPYPVKISKRIY